jgi:hypothetical protein
MSIDRVNAKKTIQRIVASISLPPQKILLPQPLTTGTNARVSAAFNSGWQARQKHVAAMKIFFLPVSVARP